MPSLAKYAVTEAEDSCRREYKEPNHPLRSPFQRDRDRIVHSKAFRRLEYKTQVFVNHLGDNFRTRLTHSIEVAQISRSVARILCLNEDLVEAIALAHDIGHPPFGHAGERVLNHFMKSHGGFDHNEQTLRTVTALEERYPGFPGLNLTEATRLGLQKHNKLPMGHGHSLEAQIVNICDEIAYNNHDLDDGLDSRLLSLKQLEEVNLWKESWRTTNKQYPATSTKIKIRYSIRCLVNQMVMNLVEQTKKNITIFKIKTFKDVMNFQVKYDEGVSAVGFSEDFLHPLLNLKKFLQKNLYRHPKVEKMNLEARKIIEKLFTHFIQNKESLPEEYQARITLTGLHKTVCDFIAGMTDRYAMHWVLKLPKINKS